MVSQSLFPGGTAFAVPFGGHQLLATVLGPLCCPPAEHDLGILMCFKDSREVRVTLTFLTKLNHGIHLCHVPPPGSVRSSRW